jgi:hypothetical protein
VTWAKGQSGNPAGGPCGDHRTAREREWDRLTRLLTLECARRGHEWLGWFPGPGGSTLNPCIRCGVQHPDCARIGAAPTP